MRSGHVIDLLSSYIDGEVSDGERERIGRHLAECDACRRHLGSLQGVVAMVKSVPAVAAPPDLRARVLADIAEGRRPRTSSAWAPLLQRFVFPAGRPGAASTARAAKRWRPARAAALAAAAALVGLFAVNLLGPGPSPVVRREAARTVHQSTPGMSRTVTMSGSAGGPAQDTGRPSAGILQPSPYQPAPGQTGDGGLRSVIRTARLALDVESVDRGAGRLLVIAEGNGGFIADSSTTEDEGSPQGQFTLRVPAPRFGAVIQDIEALGKVQQRQISARDVTGEFVDLQARLRNLEHHERQLLLFMDRADKVSDLLAIEQELSRVRGEIEQTTGRLNFLSHSVDMATVEVALSQKAAASPALWDVRGSLAKMQAALIATIRQILSVSERILVLGSALLPLAVIAAGVWLVIRRVRGVGAGA
jgi:anti-sigma factor (TIGR02949 family)